MLCPCHNVKNSWGDLKYDVYGKQSKNISELETLCKKTFVQKEQKAGICTLIFIIINIYSVN